MDNKKLTLQEFNSLSALKCAVSYNKFGGYCIPMSSYQRPAAQVVLGRYVYEPQTIKYLMQNCSGGDIVHAGTYFGDFLPALSQCCDPGAKIWAFEPNSENYSCARITILINDINNVDLLHAALGARSETLELLVTDANGQARGGTSRIVMDDQQAAPGMTETVRVTAIDDIVPQHRPVSIMHLDVEGYEKEALMGARNTIRRCSPILVLEILEGRDLVDSEWFADEILSLGYQNTGQVHGNEVFVCSKSASAP